MINPNIDIESRYCQTVPLGHRKKFAQFFTPPLIANAMANWLLANPELKNVLEPAFGLGVFSRMLLSQNPELSIKGFEIDEVIYGKAKAVYGDNKGINLLLQDYMYNDWENKYDGIICNPPYFKFHDYDNKSVLKEIEQRLDCKLNGFTNLYTLFLLKSIHQLKPHGRCAYLVPSEFMNSDYGKLVKYYLLKTGTLRHIIVFDFEEIVFEDALTTSCIILCANDENKERVTFTTISDVNDIASLDILKNNGHSIGSHQRSFSLDELSPDVKWKNYYQAQNSPQFKHLVPFSKYAKVVRGIATGANDYFTFNKSKAEQYGIDMRYLIPCICKCTDVKGQSFYASDFDELKDNDKKVFLLNAVNAKDENVRNYLAKGVAEGVDKKYLTASRNPWYALEKRQPAPIWVSVFNRKGMRFIRNYANISNLTTFHCVYPQMDLFSTVSTDLLFAYLLTDTSKRIFENNAREYGNGLQKFEPNDLNKGMMLDLELLSNCEKGKVVDLFADYTNRWDHSILQQIDEIIISRFGELDSSQCV